MLTPYALSNACARTRRSGSFMKESLLNIEVWAVLKRLVSLPMRATARQSAHVKRASWSDTHDAKQNVLAKHLEVYFRLLNQSNRNLMVMTG
jgi:hypothetical protein